MARAIAAPPAWPRVGDAVVLDHGKYRIRELASPQGLAALADSGPSWRRTPIVGHVMAPRLAWDRIVGVWRLP